MGGGGLVLGGNRVDFLKEYIYIIDSKYDTSVLPVTHIIGVSCFVNYNIYILMENTTRVFSDACYWSVVFCKL
jgi:hypothetical protein